ncbi:CaiB/BaiF CoA transferase family protein [Antarctobacter heliothermus]|uniref:Crotonobetainyl-CoA:carnitine CoA-transferase CaiB n=1 Tax=Antarctobacter heliothermus TaxID=74033 RepID=A0A239FUV2_9RHOB|nr:CaiB/BaiF CoA-transferase family protein [Antarctobacter heliothermus]SNS60609.1 Crotonobetainyl-CoA:carnitine CoA-transferase CaiB [Antarctobacter heliothermus]
MTAPLSGITVVDFSQFLSGPYASLRLLDMGARVIKIENPHGGDLCRRHYVSDTRIKGDSTLFHAINRGKESIALDLKTTDGLNAARRLIARADVVIQNFRPGVIDRLGLSYEQVRDFKPDVVYGSISGYGDSGQWAALPGQDLLAQARSGLMWLSGNAADGPVPMGLPIADISAGACLTQGLLAALFRHARTGRGGHVQTSLLEALMDMQFEFLSTWLTNAETPPQRMEQGSAHGYLGAPYGVYACASGHLALAMTPLERLRDVLNLPDLIGDPFKDREKLRSQIADCLASRPAADWEKELGARGIWCARVLTWEEMRANGGEVVRQMLPPASPIRIEGKRPVPAPQGPVLNQHGAELRAEFSLG